MDSIARSTVVLFFLSSVCAICPDAWTKYGDSCFALYEGHQAWTDAGAICREFGGHLATLNTTTKIQHAKDFVRYVNHKNNVWIGATDLALPGLWTWDVNQQSITTTDWGRHQPTGGDKTQCVMLTAVDGFRWHNMCCGSKQDYLCERRSVPQ